MQDNDIIIMLLHLKRMDIMESTIYLLLIEDDKRLADLTKNYLEKRAISVVHTISGEEGLKLAVDTHFDVVLLDIMLPGENGIEICKKMRDRIDTPIIMVTALGDEADKVFGLEVGADDYVSKPFSPRELLARINAIVRRARGHAGPKQSRISVGPLTVDPISREASLDNKQLDLTSYEFSLLQALAENAGKVLSRDRLMDLAKGNIDESFDRSIDVHISRLRQKLGDNPRKPWIIKTIRGIGYQLIVKDEK